MHLRGDAKCHTRVPIMLYNCLGSEPYRRRGYWNYYMLLSISLDLSEWKCLGLSA